MKSNQNMSDQELYGLCREYGAAALEARRKFTGLLPEVMRRGLHRNKGFGSIYEFAAKLAGMSMEQVDRVLSLDKKFEDKPALREALMEGEVSVNKLARVASIATNENQKELVEKSKVLSNRALETFVRDIKGLTNVENELNFVHVHKLELNNNILQELQELQNEGTNINEFLRECLERRKLEIAQEKEELSEEMERQASNKYVSRHIPAKVRKLIRKEYGTKCSIRGCFKDAKTIHHTKPFSIDRSHDPQYLAQLCHEHHEIAHAVNVKVCEKRSGPT
jgi:hypothetical protein